MRRRTMLGAMVGALVAPFVAKEAKAAEPAIESGRPRIPTIWNGVS